MKTPSEWIEYHQKASRYRPVSEEDIKAIQDDARKDILESEHKLSDAYLRLRTLIPGAFDTPHAPTAEQIYEITEKALEKLTYNIKE